MSFNNSPVLVLELPKNRHGLYASAALMSCAFLFLCASYVGLLRISMFFTSMLSLIAFGAALAAFWRNGAYKSTNRVSNLVWQQEGDWWLRFSEGQSVAAVLMPTSWVTSRVWCLRFQVAGRNLPVIVVWRGHYSEMLWQSWLTRLHLQARIKPSAESVT